MRSAKACAAIVGLATSGLMFSPSAHAQGMVTIEKTWTFNDASGSCDSFFAPGVCSLDSWWTGGRAGWSTANGNGFLWISNDDPWNSWNTQFNASGYTATNGECNVTASVFSTLDSYTSIGELDLWENDGNGLAPLSIGNTIWGTNGAWTTQSWYDLPIGKAVADDRPVLMVLGRHQGQGNQEFIALDNVTAYCWVYDSP